MADLWYDRRKLPFINMVVLLCLLVLFKVGMITTSNVTTSTNTCHPQCVCLSHLITVSVNCSSQGFTSMPDDLPRNSTTLLLNNNKIQTVAPEILSTLPLLTKIDVSYNKIRCDCSLSWVLNSSLNLKIIGQCDSPSSLQGRNISDVLYHEMCAPMYSCGSRSPRKSTHDRSKRIVGGSEAKRNSWPWMVNFIDDKKLQQCAGTIISREWILTTAHCFVYDEEPFPWENYTYHVGDHNFNVDDPGEYLVKLSGVFHHPHYNFSVHQNDITLLKLETPLNYSEVARPLCLPEQTTHFSKNDTCYTTGWGNTKDSIPYHRSPYLKELNLDLVSREQCNRNVSYHGLVTDTFVCAGFEEGGVGGCYGDSGGPLQCVRDGIWTQLGIMVWGYTCSKPNHYGVYTDIRKYLPFIKAIQKGPNVNLTAFYQKSLVDIKPSKTGGLINLHDLLTKDGYFTDIDLVRNLELTPREIQSVKKATLADLEFISEEKFGDSTKLVHIVDVLLTQRHQLRAYQIVMEAAFSINLAFDDMLRISELSKDSLLNYRFDMLRNATDGFLISFFLEKLSGYKKLLMSYNANITIELNASKVAEDLKRMSVKRMARHPKLVKQILVKDNSEVFTEALTVQNISAFFEIKREQLLNMTVVEVVENVLGMNSTEFASSHMFHEDEVKLLKSRKISSVAHPFDQSLVVLAKSISHVISSSSTPTVKIPSNTVPMTESTEPTKMSTRFTTNITDSPTTFGPAPTISKPYLNLTDLIRTSNKTQPNVESLRNMLESLERNVHNWSHGRDQGLLHVVSNLLRNENRNILGKSNQNFSGVERLLGIANEVVTAQAKDMLNNHRNGTHARLVELDNLNVEILVGMASVIGKKKLVFPRSRKPQDDSIEFPSSVFQKGGQKKVAIVIISFNQLGELLPRLSLMDGFNSFQINSRVLSANVVSLGDSFSTSVTIKFKNKNTEDAVEKPTRCAFWKYGNTLGSGVNGSKAGWSNKGCYVSSKTNGGTICKCDHLTDFAVLTKDAIVPVKPTLIMYIGGLVLLVALVIVFFRDIIVWRQTRRERLAVLINQCFAMILAVIVFLLGVFFDYENVMCTVFGALLHWFLLAVFCWLLAEVLQLYLGVRFGCNRNSVRLRYFLLLGWVFPIVFVGIMLAVTKLEIYGSNKWCWYSNSAILHWTYIGPVALCILIDLIVILKVACLKADLTDDDDKRDVGILLWLSGFLFPLVAATFASGALSANQPDKTVFQFVFAIFGVVLGVYLLVYHFLLDREITKMSVRTSNRARPKRDYYSTKDTVTYSEGTPEGKKISLIFPSRKSPPHAKKSKGDKRAKRNESVNPFDYDESSVPMYPSINDSSLKSFRSEVSAQRQTLENPPDTLSAIKVSRPDSQCIELTSLSDLDRRPDGAEQTDCVDAGEFYGGSRHSNPVDKVRQRTSGSSDSPHASTFGKDSRKSASGRPNEEDPKNRTSVTSSAGISRTSRSSVSGASIGAAEGVDQPNDDSLEHQPILRSGTITGPEVRSDPPAKIPKRRKKGSRRRLDDELGDEDVDQTNVESEQKLLPAPSKDEPIEQQYTSF